MPDYSHLSSYAETDLDEYYLDLMVNRSIPKYADDLIIEISEVYNMRPDLMAHDLYEDSELWWVFAARNPDTLKNPLLDFTVGTKIYVPDIDTLRQELGF